MSSTAGVGILYRHELRPQTSLQGGLLGSEQAWITTGSIMNGYIWLGIGICITQSAMFSGLNLAVFSVSRLRLEAAAHAGDRNAARVLRLRRDANFALATILWGNVSVNVLLTILADSVLAGAAAFVFSTVLITFLGEILPQAYFARHALRMAALLTPLLRAYQVLLWVVAKPTAKMLDAWVGPESIPWFRERELRDVLQQHARVGGTELSSSGGIGVLLVVGGFIYELWISRASKSPHRQRARARSEGCTPLRNQPSIDGVRPRFRSDC